MAYGRKRDDQQRLASVFRPTLTRRRYLKGLTTAGAAVLISGCSNVPGVSSSSQPWRQTTKLTASDSDGNDFFGQSVALDGPLAVIGAYQDEDPNGFKGGSVYVFAQEDGRWGEEAKLAPSDGGPEKEFGLDVATSGETAVISAWNDDNDNGERAGAAYVFTRADGTWTETAKLTASDGAEGHRFGKGVSIDGDTLVACSPGIHDPFEGGRGVGAAYVFTRSGDTWREEAQLMADDGDEGDIFGDNSAIDGDTVVIGAYGDWDPNGEFGGSAYVFTREGDGWSQQAKLVPSDGDSFDGAGFVALDGDTAVVGAPGDEDPNGDKAGSVYVFTRSGDTWREEAKLAADDGDEGDQFGHSVAVRGDTVLVTAFRDEDPNGPSAGAAYVFTRTNGEWVQQQKITPDDGDASARFGSLGVALQGDRALVGAPGMADKDGNRGAGSAYVFERNE